jgi:hypothetical protein
MRLLSKLLSTSSRYITVDEASEKRLVYGMLQLQHLHLQEHPLQFQDGQHVDGLPKLQPNPYTWTKVTTPLTIFSFLFFSCVEQGKFLAAVSDIAMPFLFPQVI